MTREQELIDRLRSITHFNSFVGAKIEKDRDILIQERKEAADELERLQAEVERLQEETVSRSFHEHQVNELRSEVERMKVALEYIADKAYNLDAAQAEECARLALENV